MSFLGDFPEDFATVTCMFTTHAATGATVAPSTALEAADVQIFKNGSATEKTSTNGLTMTSPFNGVTGLHCLVIDTSNDTGDGGFWVAGAQYTVVLVPDETVDGLAVAKVIGTFGLALAPVFARLGAPAGASIAADIAAIEAQTDDIGAAGAGLTALASAADLATLAGYVDTEVAAIKAKTDNLPSDPADQSLIIDATNALATLVGDVPTNAELSTALGTADDAVLAAIGALPTANENADALLDRAAGVETGLTPRQAFRLFAAALLGKASGLATTTAVFRDTGDTKDRITATVDADGNRADVVLDAT